MKTKPVFLVLVVLLIGVLLAGCRTYYAKDSYFEGDVTVEYQQTQQRGTDDCLTFVFYEEGEYKVSFSITPEKGKLGADYMPEDFEITITEAPREHIVKQYILPYFLRVTIERDGVPEYHDFQ